MTRLSVNEFTVPFDQFVLKASSPNFVAISSAQGEPAMGSRTSLPLLRRVRTICCIRVVPHFGKVAITMSEGKRGRVRRESIGPEAANGGYLH